MASYDSRTAENETEAHAARFHLIGEEPGRCAYEARSQGVQVR